MSIFSSFEVTISPSKENLPFDWGFPPFLAFHASIKAATDSSVNGEGYPESKLESKVVPMTQFAPVSGVLMVVTLLSAPFSAADVHTLNDTKRMISLRVIASHSDGNGGICTVIEMNDLGPDVMTQSQCTNSNRVMSHHIGHAKATDEKTYGKPSEISWLSVNWFQILCGRHGQNQCGIRWMDDMLKLFVSSRRVFGETKCGHELYQNVQTQSMNDNECASL